MTVHSRLVLAALGTLLLQGCAPHFNMVREEKFYYFPPGATAWRHLDSGVDVHWWLECYKGVDERLDAACHTMNMVALPAGATPDWHKTAVSRRADWSMFDYHQITPVLSAHSGTPHRVLGTVDNGAGRVDILLLQVGGDKVATISNVNSQKRVVRKDIWHNAVCSDAGAVVPRLVVEDERALWIFADAEAGCELDKRDWRAPLDMMTFDHPERHGTLLRKPMQLFYSDGVERTDFNQPREVTANAKLLAKAPARVVSMDKLASTAGKVFTLDEGVVNAPLSDHQPRANLRCRYTATHFYFTIFEDASNPTVSGCEPITPAATTAEGRGHTD